MWFIIVVWNMADMYWIEWGNKKTNIWDQNIQHNNWQMIVINDLINLERYSLL